MSRRATRAHKNSKVEQKMVSINYAFKEICCKIVFYGPGLSGKTTNLQYVHQKIPPQTRGELISLATDQDRTLYFDFLPVDIGKIRGFSVKFQLYTVPGQVYYNATRKLVLRGVDGLVFVADSQRSKMDENIESYQNLVENLEGYGYHIEKLPLVFQYNKRDLSDISSVDELERILNPRGLFHFEAVATRGIGVFDTLKCISRLVLDLAKGEKVVPEREVPVEERMMVESNPAPPERSTGLEGLKTSISTHKIRDSGSLFSKRLEPLRKKEKKAIREEKIPSASEEWPGSPHPHRSSQAGEPLLAQPPIEHESHLSAKREELEAEKGRRSAEGVTHDQQGKKVNGKGALPKTEETPTIIGWSAARQKKRSEPKRFFLWRFFKRLLNR